MRWSPHLRRNPTCLTCVTGSCWGRSASHSLPMSSIRLRRGPIAPRRDSPHRARTPVGRARRDPRGAGSTRRRAGLPLARLRPRCHQPTLAHTRAAQRSRPPPLDPVSLPLYRCFKFPAFKFPCNMLYNMLYQVTCSRRKAAPRAPEKPSGCAAGRCSRPGTPGKSGDGPRNASPNVSQAGQTSL